MPQESLRSFITCDDPNGVIEGKTVRISTKMEGSKIEIETNPKTLKKSSSSSNRREDKEKMSKIASEVEKNQLVEVNKGAQKLNQVIKSWSKGIGFEKQSRDVAKDLLKGALDLQESLMMLGRLQEASHYMTKFKKKEKSKSKEEVLVSSNTFENQSDYRNYNMGFQNLKNSIDGSSRDCYDELRDVIRDGLMRQNLLSNKANKDHAFSGKKKLQLSPDVASTSSSKSSSMEEKSKGSNLIAKLMGLEDLPLKALPKKQLNCSKIKDQKRPVFEIDLPRAKKPQFLDQKMGHKKPNLDEIIEMMQIKGLLRSSKHKILQTTNFRLEKNLDDHAPPIVIMKPRRLAPEDDFVKRKMEDVESRKVKAEANPIIKINQEKAKDVKIIKRKLTSDEQKVSVFVVSKPKRNEEIEKKVDKIQKMARKPLEIENAKSRNSIHKSISSKQEKPQKSAISKPISKRSSSLTLTTTKSNDRKKDVKIKNTIKPSKANVRNVRTEDEILQINLATENAKTASNDEESEDCEVLVKEIDYRIQHSPCEIYNRNGNEAPENEDSYCITDLKTEKDHSKTSENHQENVVSYINRCKDRILKKIATFHDFEPPNSRLLLDCVNEFFEHENLQKITTIHPLFQSNMLKSRFCILEDDLLKEITCGIEILQNYSKLSSVDFVYELLERDLWWKSSIGGGWSRGWRDGCSLDEVEEVVLDLEKMVLSKLIDDLVKEFVT